MNLHPRRISGTHGPWRCGLAAALFSIVLLSACGAGQRGKPEGPRDADLLTLAPSGVYWVGILDIDSLRASPWWARMKELSLENEELQTLKDKAGLDPEQEVSRVVIANYSPKAGDKKIVVTVKGKWTLDKIKETVRNGTNQKGAWKERVEEGIAIWERGEDVAMFVPDSTVVFTNTTMSGKVIPLVTKMEGEPLRRDSAFAEVEKLKDATFAVVGKNIDLEPLGAYIPTLRNVLIDLLTIKFRLTTTLDADLKAVMKDEKQATQVEKVMQVALEKSRNQPVVRLLGFDQFLDAVTISRSANTVQGKLVLTEAQLKDLFTLVERFKGMQEALEKSQQGAPLTPQEGQ